MGAVAKQSIYSVITTYIGLFIGLANLYCYTSILEPSQKGILDSLLNNATMIVAVGGLGINFSINKFLPYYLHYNSQKNDIAYRLMYYSVPAMVLLFFIMYALHILLYTSQNNLEVLGLNYINIGFLVYGLFIYQLLSSYSIGFSKIVVVAFINDIVIRCINLSTIFLYYFDFIDFNSLLAINSCIYLIGCAILILYLNKNSIISFSNKEISTTKRLLPKMITFSLYSWVGNIFHLMVQFIDNIFIVGLYNFDDYAYYFLAIQIIIFMTVVQRSLTISLIPLISNAWQRKDIPKLTRIYQKSANNFLWFGSLIFLLIILNINEVLIFLRPEYLVAKPIILIMGITKIIDLSTGVNAQILNLSRNYWKLDLLINIVAVCFLIPVNYFLIKNYGTIGCAFGNFILISVFNIVKTITIYRYIKIHPYSKANLYLLFFILVNLVIVWLFFYDNGGATLNSKFEIVLKVAFKSIIFIAIFTYSLYLTKIAEEFNTTVQKMITKINNFIKIYSH